MQPRKPRSTDTATAAPMLVVGTRSHPLRDIYHLLLRTSWPTAIGLLVAVYLVINLAFAVAYWRVGGVVHAEPGSFRDAFFFSVQTLATVGYGGMYPVSNAANVLMTIELITGVIVTALFTGLVFSKFARSTARIVFSRHLVVTPRNGVPTLMLRIGNDRNDSVLDAHVRCVLMRTTRTEEGDVFYEMVDLKLARDVAPVLARSFAIMHRIDAGSPLYQLSPEDYAAQEIEVMVSVSGIDETTKGPIHAVHTYDQSEILQGHRFLDVLTERRDGRLVLDVRRFHDVEALLPHVEIEHAAEADT
jgi:inward rectifier potassium channel